MKHIIRFINHMFIFLFVCLPLMLLGIPMVAIGLSLIYNSDLKLPWFCRWWDNADLYTARNTTSYKEICLRGKWTRYCWLAFRNPMNYFDYAYLGLKWFGNEVYTHYDPKNNDVGDGTRSGFKYIEVVHGREVYYEYYLIYQFPFWPEKCFRYRMGWKIGDNNNKPFTISQWCLVIAPFFPYTGK